MTDQNSVVEHQIRPLALMEELGIKKDAYYAYLKRLNITAEKDSDGKAFLTEAQAELVRELRRHVVSGGKIDEFVVSNASMSPLAMADGAWMQSAEDVLPAPETEVSDMDMESLYLEASEIAAQRLTAKEQVVLAMASQMGYEDLHPKTKAKVDNVRAATVPKFNPQALAADLMSKYRQQQPLQTRTV